MTTISELTGATAVTASTQFVGTDSQSDFRYPVSLLATYLQTTLASPVRKDAYSPTTGQTIIVTFNGPDVWLPITPVGTIADLTITIAGTPTDGQELLVNTSQTITALTMNAQVGASLQGAPTTLSADGFARLRYDGTVWRRVG